VTEQVTNGIRRRDLLPGSLAGGSQAVPSCRLKGRWRALPSELM
jgi:hypothetical protein